MIRAGARMGGAEMPLMRYFVFVGGVLLALLFVSDAYGPRSPVVSRTDTATPAEHPTLRIRSDRKWPDPVVFDTSLPTIVPVPTATTEAGVPAPAGAADAPAKVRALDAFAQSTDPKKPEPKLQRKRKIAKRHVAPRMVPVAQQPRFGFFANDTW
jgi:hypothetical protein